MPECHRLGLTVRIVAATATRGEESRANLIRVYGRINALYGTAQIPETYVIDRQGMLRRKFVSAQDWTSPEIEQYLRSL